MYGVKTLGEICAEVLASTKGEEFLANRLGCSIDLIRNFKKTLMKSAIICNDYFICSPEGYDKLEYDENNPCAINPDYDFDHDNTSSCECANKELEHTCYFQVNKIVKKELKRKGEDWEEWYLVDERLLCEGEIEKGIKKRRIIGPVEIPIGISDRVI